MKQKPYYIFIIILLLLLLTLIVPIFADTEKNDYDHIFSETSPSVSVFDALTPERTANGIGEVYCKVISKLNQPRNTNGTNPHGGVDFNMDAGTLVYPIANGTVVRVDNSETKINQQMG